MTLSKFPIRLILSVMVGIAISMILSALTHFVLHLVGLFPPSFEPMFETRLVFISLAFHSVYAVIGAYVTAYIAREKARKAVFYWDQRKPLCGYLESYCCGIIHRPGIILQKLFWDFRWPGLAESYIRGGRII